MPSTELNPAAEPQTRYCINCRYALRGLRDHRCPECGRVFDPHDLRTTCESPAGRWLWPTWLSSHAIRAGILAVGAAACFSPLGELLTIYYRGFSFYNGPILLSGITLLLYCCVLRRPIWGRHTVVGLAVAMVLLVVYFGPEFHIYHYTVGTLLPWSVPVLLISLSAFHFLRCRQERDVPGQFYRLLPAILAWLYLLVVFGLIVLGEETNPVDYWTHWFWVSDRW